MGTSQFKGKGEVKKIAIVGSEERYWAPKQRAQVVQQIIKLLGAGQWVNSGKGFDWIRDDIILVSGGCHKGGVDIWAEVVADTLKVPKDIKHPEIFSWEDGEYEDSPVPLDRLPRIGYRDRNKLIAEECDVLYCFDPPNRDWSGGRWTHDYAKRLGKETHLIIVREEE